MTQHALITGANGGIGRALCSTFTAAGYSVVATDRSAECEASCDHYIPADLAAVVRQADASDKLSATLKDIIASSQLSVLINNAAVQHLGATSELSISDFSNSLDVNVTAPFLLSRMCLPYLESSGGSIINIGSIHARQTKPRFAAYATSKAALDGLTRALAIDIGDRVRVNAINPAAIATEMLAAGFSSNPQGYEALQRYHPVKRIGEPAEVARLALFLASATEAGFINGSSIDVSGGIHARLHDPD